MTRNAAVSLAVLASAAALLVAPAGLALAPTGLASVEIEGASCTPHPPIHVDGDEGFTWTNPATSEAEPQPGSGVTGGSGTSDDPYVIEGWCILVNEATSQQADGSGIKIESTSAHVLVQDNLVHARTSTSTLTSGAGVWVQDAENVQIVDNTVLAHERDGITVDASTDVGVHDNRLEDHLEAGLAIENAEDVEATGNAITGNGEEGILVGGSTGVLLEANTVADNVHGVRLTKSGLNEVHDNTIEANEEQGVQVKSLSVDNEIAANTIEANGQGVVVSTTGQNTIDDNAILDQDGDGVHLTHAMRVTVTNNTIADSGGDGVAASSAPGAEVANNTVERSQDDGIDLFLSGDATIHNNTLADNTGAGAALYGSDETSLAHNEITGDTDGVTINVGGFATTGKDITLEGNDVAGNEDAGLVAESSQEAIDARDNWWGHADGPSGGVEDCETDEVANGLGDEIETTDAQVCFDPWLDQPDPDAGVG